MSEIYDPSTGKWNSTANLAVLLSYHTTYNLTQFRSSICHTKQRRIRF